MTKLKVMARKIKCKDPQDPRRDEIYFITAIGGKSNITKTIRGVSRGSEFENVVLFDDEFDTENNSPIIVTFTEERALKDDGDFAKALEKVATQAVGFAKKKLATTPVSAVIATIGGWVLDNVISLAKYIFQDQVLATKVIPLPYDPEFQGKVYDYKIKAKKKDFPSYDYSIDLEIKFE